MHYRSLISQTPWRNVQMVITGKSDLLSHWQSVVQFFAEGELLLCLDASLQEVLWKQHPGPAAEKNMVPLPAGGLQNLVFDAYDRMQLTGARICGLHVGTQGMQIDG